MTRRVLVTAPYLQPVLDRFRFEFERRAIELIVPQVEERCSEAELMQWIEVIDGAICGDDAFTERVLLQAKRLKVISKWGTGIDSIDRAACERLGIAVRNTPNAFTEPVADSVLGYLLAFARQLPFMDAAMKQSVWDKIPGRALGECTLGIVGAGNIGRAVAKRAAAFGMNLLANDPVPVPREVTVATGLQQVALEELLDRSDFVSLSCDLNPSSRGLMNDVRFAAMKPTAILINTARGPLVEERALERALIHHVIAGAALDVFELEPLPASSPLRALPQVMLAPHNSNSSPRAWERVHQSTLRNLFEVLEERGP